MKRLALTVAAAALTWLGTTSEGSARPHCGDRPSTYVSTYTRCGCPVYVQRYIAYYDHCGRPVWQTRVLRVNHRCGGWNRGSSCRDGYRSNGSYGQYSYDRGSGYRGGVEIRARW